ncbi:unnamed protein product [Vitrella brassicaformis CCMP3155]|uniref:CAAX prenyl protease 2/Lysostaphin resistance protein A-like domain-containing protein n=1 Tax=Vitrella brassicaformis (strain CCMP3155) TaxID=1169540 RepID=A0A0G4FW66_VITBC|nr:unnamed protein product [Vitrella brassicaformis CCMP3155]|mmetsp:Transcript_48594/g.121650  ORF Transcript_48594/g.121650 Transcript_48594/m.121650 type:complete len:200 (-) Transcript_48594:576-1175(-)|eukprot:CEM19435.1 unnamed protein product [Vitrella brassicaformis CCMP3155]
MTFVRWLHQLWSSKLRPAFSLPRPCDWGALAIAVGAYAAIAVPIGFSTGILKRKVADLPAWRIAAGSAAALVVPCFVEELVFRVLLLPTPAYLQQVAERLSQNSSGARGYLVLIGGAAIIVNTAIFVAMHPLNAVLLRPEARRVFLNVWFLVLCGVLGVTAGTLYLLSGRVWGPTLLHWFVVFPWLFFLGGYAKLRGEE